MMNMPEAILEKYMQRWALSSDGEPLTTKTSGLLPVRYKNFPAMLKIALVPEEQVGGQLMCWWNGEGAAQILAHEDEVFLMERAIGKNSLTTMAKQGQVNEVSHIVCDVVAQLHSNRDKSLPPALVPLHDWFGALYRVAAQQGGAFTQAAAIARELLREPQEEVVLHGDIHHANILDFGARGWLAIDPKGLLGERGYDYANTFCNPSMEVVTRPNHLEQQVMLISALAGLDPIRLKKWIVAYAGLSAAWHIEEGGNPELPLAVAHIALFQQAS